MAEKFRDGISRELRYVEYKLRKKNKTKRKPVSGTLDSSAPNIPENFKEVVPSSHGEEDLQLQVRFAVAVLHNFLL